MVAWSVITHAMYGTCACGRAKSFDRAMAAVRVGRRSTFPAEFEQLCSHARVAETSSRPACEKSGRVGTVLS